MAIDWKTIISEFDGKPTLLQAIGKLRKAVEDETITIQQAQAEIAKLESQQKADEALIKTAQSTADEAKINAYNASQKGDQALGKATTAGTKAQNALDLATTNETDIGTLDGQVAQIETNLNNKQDKITNQTELTARSLTTVKDIICENNLKGRYLFCSHTNMGSPSNSPFLIFEYGQNGIVKSNMRFQTFANMNKNIVVNFPNEDGTVAYTKNFKTIFGNQSLVGTGNIELYRHTISIDVLNKLDPVATIYITYISSSNLIVGSLTDLKTLIKELNVNNKHIGCTGFTTGEYGTIFAIYNQDGAILCDYITSNGINSITLSNCTIADTVTTI